LRAKPQSAANDALVKELDALAPPAAAPGAYPARRAAPAAAGAADAEAPAERAERPEPEREARRPRPRRFSRERLPRPATGNFNTNGAAMVQAVMGCCRARKWPPTAAQLKACTDRMNEYARAGGQVECLEVETQGCGNLI
jgi:hypothetical protein